MIKVNVIKCIKEVKYHKFHFNKGENYLMTAIANRTEGIKIFENNKSNWLDIIQLEHLNFKIEEFFEVTDTIYVYSKRGLKSLTIAFKNIDEQRNLLRKLREG